jgi:hypothetical protein
MPFRSEKQRRFLWWKHPEVARKFAKHGKRKKGGKRGKR